MYGTVRHFITITNVLSYVRAINRMRISVDNDKTKLLFDTGKTKLLPVTVTQII